MNVITVPKSQFKPKAFQYLRMVESNQQEVCITDHGKPVVRLIPYATKDEKILKGMRNLITSYKDPLSPVADDEWEVLS